MSHEIFPAEPDYIQDLDRNFGNHLPDLRRRVEELNIGSNPLEVDVITWNLIFELDYSENNSQEDRYKEALERLNARHLESDTISRN